MGLGALGILEPTFDLLSVGTLKSQHGPEQQAPGAPKGETSLWWPPPQFHEGRGAGVPHSLVDSKVEDFGRVPSVFADHLP